MTSTSGPSSTSPDRTLDEVYRAEWGRLVSLLVSRTRRLDLAEDALSEAFARAAEPPPGPRAVRQRRRTRPPARPTSGDSSPLTMSTEEPNHRTADPADGEVAKRDAAQNGSELTAPTAASGTCRCVEMGGQSRVARRRSGSSGRAEPEGQVLRHASMAPSRVGSTSLQVCCCGRWAHRCRGAVA